VTPQHQPIQTHTDIHTITYYIFRDTHINTYTHMIYTAHTALCSHNNAVSHLPRDFIKSPLGLRAWALDISVAQAFVRGV
jgi:hypothetical protein